MKQCKKCGEIKHHYKNQNQCKDCKSIYNKEWNKTPKGKLNWVRSSNKWKNKIQGVYGIFSDMTCLYVGESGQLYNRISQHKTCIKNPNGVKSKRRQLYNLLQKHNNLEFRILEETPNHKTQERIWIEYLCPLYNTI